MLIGERLRIIRESKQMSQGDIEKRTGLLRCYVSRVENGHTVPSLETMEKWSKALDISMSQLFAEDGKPAKPLLTVLKNGDSLKLNRAAENHLRRVGTAFAKMQPRYIAIVSGLALKFAAAK